MEKYQGQFTLKTKDVRFAQNYAHVEINATEDDSVDYATYQVAISPHVVEAAEGHPALNLTEQSYYGDAVVSAIRDMLNLALDAQGDDAKGEVHVEVLKVIVGAKPDLSATAEEDAPKFLSSNPVEDVKRAARMAVYAMAMGAMG